MSLSEEERDIVVKHRLNRANETLEETRDLVVNNRWHGAANRLYYACYYAVTALLTEHGHPARTHSGAIGLLGEHFIRTGIINKEYNKLYQKLFDLRLGGDYSDWIVIEEEDILPLLDPAERLIETIENLINDSK